MEVIRAEALKRADALQARLQKRLEQLQRERQIAPLPPVVLGGLLVVPAEMIAAMTSRPLPAGIELVDRQAAAAAVRESGRTPSR
ncbi:MAG: hypothetical protein AB1761_18940 [Pseudomonadota bacterium]